VGTLASPRVTPARFCVVPSEFSVSVVLLTGMESVALGSDWPASGASLHGDGTGKMPVFPWRYELPTA